MSKCSFLSAPIVALILKTFTLKKSLFVLRRTVDSFFALKMLCVSLGLAKDCISLVLLLPLVFKCVDCFLHSCLIFLMLSIQ